ncbi:uncharacterized protein LOC110988879 [Acanthaster planci]|uniref:Uncharacterized protein LOC110988879 n=1 Tax=Acanthaster planci TaxID=133434 RepID=A0A8B7ZSE3_ACAPL|nr:uncharacterized protein LOC110988879 [Acanthaster planci]
MPGRNFSPIIRPGHYPDKLPTRTKNRQCTANPHATIQKTIPSQLQRQLKQRRISLTTQRKSGFCVKVQKAAQMITDEPGLCGNCHLTFDRIRSHLRKCHPRLYRRVILALRNAQPITEANPANGGNAKEPSNNRPKPIVDIPRALYN